MPLKKLLALLLLAVGMFYSLGYAVWAGGPAPVVPGGAAVVTPTPTPAVTSVVGAVPAATPVATPQFRPSTRVFTPDSPPDQVEVRFITNLRAGPNSAFQVVRVVEAGARLPVLACNPDCSWYEVEPNVWVAAYLVIPLETVTVLVEGDVAVEVEGPVQETVVTLETGPAVTVIAPAENVIVVPGTVAQIPQGRVTVRVDTRIYRGPGTAYPQARVVEQGTELVVVGRNSGGNWYVLVSGDWIAAAAVMGAPADLPTAWEPPPPPGGPDPVSVNGTNNLNATAQSIQSNDHNEIASSSNTQSSPTNTSCININTASFDQLRLIIHIDEDRAGQILQLRAQLPFRSVDNMTRINGIAEVRLQEIKSQGLACVG